MEVQALSRIQSKMFEKLQTVKRIHERVKAVDGKYVFQDVFNSFRAGKDTAKNEKDLWLKLVSEVVPSRLENDSSPASKFSSIILNTEG